MQKWWLLFKKNTENGRKDREGQFLQRCREHFTAEYRNKMLFLSMRRNTMRVLSTKRKADKFHFNIDRGRNVAHRSRSANRSR